MTERGGEPLLRMTEGGSAAQNDGLPPFVVPRPTPFAIPRPTSFVILSEAKNLPSRLKDMVRKILRSEAPQNDRERGRAAPQNDREGEICSSE